MSDVLVGALTVLLATNPATALTNLVAERTGLKGLTVSTNNPVERELDLILAEDDAAQTEIAGWMDEVESPKDPLNAPLRVTLRARIQQRVEPVKRRYQDFILANPRNARAQLAFGSFLNDLGEEGEAIVHWEKARELDPQNPAGWNNLANVYAHIGPVTKSFPYYETAIRLNPNEPVYLHNFGTLVFLFRRDATNYFKCDEQAVFTKAFELYQQAIKLDPGNFQLAADIAQTYYGWRFPATLARADLQREEAKLTETAMRAWTNALAIAPSDYDREGVYLHFARWNLRQGRFDAARTNLNTVTSEAYGPLKERLTRSLAEREKTGLPLAPE